GRGAARPPVLDADRMLTRHARGQREFGARDVVAAAGAGAGDSADEEVARGDVERGRVAEDEAQREQALRREPIVIIGILAGVEGTDAGIARAGEDRALGDDRIGKPQLARGAERERGARHAKNLRRDVIVAAVETPDAPEVLAPRVVRADKQAARLHA